MAIRVLETHHRSRYGRAVLKVALLFSRIMIVATAAFTLSAPGMAWNVHFFSHGSDKIAADQHHHHDGESIDVHDHSNQTADSSQDSDGKAPNGGHSHHSGATAMMAFDVPGELVTTGPEKGIEQFTILDPDEPVSTLGAPPAQPPQTV